MAPIAEAEAQSEQATMASKVDNQGNQLNEDGTLMLEKVSSIDEITD